GPEVDLLDRRDPRPLHTPVDLDDVRRSETLSPRVDPGPTPAPDKVPEWAWPSTLDRAPAAAAPREEPRAAPEPLAPPEPVRSARAESSSGESPHANRPLDPDA